MEPKLGSKFYLMGHSLGAYLGGHYALKFPHRVEKLVMVSPPGVSTKEQKKCYQSLIKSDMSYFPAGLEALIQLAFYSKLTPYDAARFLGPWLGGMVLDAGIRIRCRKCSQREQ